MNDLNKLTNLIEGLATADIVDAMAKTFSHRAHILDLVSPTPDRVLFGAAVTIGFMPVRKDLMDPHKHSLGPAFYRAIADEDPTGKVLVISSGGNPTLSLGGGTKLSRVKNHKMAGILADGRLRDFDDLGSYGIATWCTGETTRAGGNMIQPYLHNVPVIVDEVTVVPGDYVFADKTGAVIIPADKVEEILKMAHKILGMATSMLPMIANEKAEDILNTGSKEA